MKTYFLDASRFSNPDAFYDEVSRVFGFPEYFGRNLDALADCLSELELPGAVVWIPSSDDHLEPDFRNAVFEVFSSIEGVDFRMG